MPSGHSHLCHQKEVSTKLSSQSHRTEEWDLCSLQPPSLNTRMGTLTHTHQLCGSGKGSPEAGAGFQTKGSQLVTSTSLTPPPPQVRGEDEEFRTPRPRPADGQELPPLLPHYLSHLPLLSMFTDKQRFTVYSGSYHLPSAN